MFKKLTNPFTYIAGKKSLLIGLLVIFATSIVAFYSNTYFPDIISVKMGVDLSLISGVTQNFLNWIVVSLLFYLAAISLSKSKIRIVDIFGTQALARIPYFFVSLISFSEVIDLYGKYLLWVYMKHGEPIEITMVQKSIAVFFLFVSLLLTIWLVTLMFNAYKVAANLKGARLIASFIVIMIISMVVLTYLSPIILSMIK
ncbi:hypothetical protein MM239_08760 [Belliella sp. DSM 111904]|uniref:Yip1 domain-containing protein n=1 Tax=Belliella filtrata TaxID=2923435 RepID=A0ABS9UZI5_9BACT|nr:hypothetical protein [Belliella filtrata]MCH7409483.1 hypothetical protein [Belliella filtrata]